MSSSRETRPKVSYISRGNIDHFAAASCSSSYAKSQRLNLLPTMQWRKKWLSRFPATYRQWEQLVGVSGTIMDDQDYEGECIIGQSVALVIGVRDKKIIALLVSAYNYRLATI
jgi:hypothetical protein